MIRSWVLSSSESWRALSVPDDAPVTFAQGSNADRLLLVGSGTAVSYGVLSHDLGLAGHLARRLTALTGRGTSIDVRAFPEMTIEDAIGVVSAPETSRYDAVVATLGGSEALNLRSTQRWRRSLEQFLTTLQTVSPSTKAFLVGVPAVSHLVRMPWFYGWLVERHSSRITAVTQEISARFPAAEYLPFDPKSVHLLDDMTRTLYRDWAELLAPPIADALDTDAGDTSVHGAQQLPQHSGREVARQSALARMGIVDSEADEEIIHVVANARDLFGASGAGLNIIDGARQWVMAAEGMSTEDTPREQSICSTTIEMVDVLVIEDTLDDHRFADLAWVRGVHPVRFYAGYPIEDPEGYRLGALCVVDTKPRTFSASDEALLRELAMRIQSLLWANARSQGKFRD